MEPVSRFSTWNAAGNLWELWAQRNAARAAAQAQPTQTQSAQTQPAQAQSAQGSGTVNAAGIQPSSAASAMPLGTPDTSSLPAPTGMSAFSNVLGFTPAATVLDARSAAEATGMSGVSNGLIPGAPLSGTAGSSTPAQTSAPSAVGTQSASSSEQLPRLETEECQTCKNRKYQDGSNDPGVSYKTPTTISADQAASAVRGHEMEHVTREQAKARRDNREVVSQSVTMHTAICPECGRVYVSGGTTRTVTRGQSDQNSALDPAQTNSADPSKEKGALFSATAAA